MRMQQRRPVNWGTAGTLLMVGSFVADLLDHARWVGFVSVVGVLIGLALVVADSLLTYRRRRS
jgi:hypothetical protein